MAAAYFLGISGIKATVYEKKQNRRYSKKRHTFFRISDEAIDKDVELIKKIGRGNKT